ncbi:MAG: methylated-DNA--[protein]-cysteine S-methyltransferase [Betaproteobacteria bacterium]
MMMNLDAKHNALINTPFGAVSISVQGNQLAIDLLSESPSADNQLSAHPLVKQAYAQIMQYLQRPSTQFDWPLNAQGTAFQQRVWQAIAAIPLGKTITYGQLAEKVGSAPRAVANACGANAIPLMIPCHRVVAQKGIGGFMQGKPNGLFIKQWLLAHEGVVDYAQGDKHE